MSLNMPIGLLYCIDVNSLRDHTNVIKGLSLFFRSNADHRTIAFEPLQGPQGCHPYTYMASARNWVMSDVSAYGSKYLGVIFSGFCKGCPILFHGTSVAHQGLWGGVSSTGPPDAGQGPHARWLRFRLVHVRLLGLFKSYSMPCKKRSGPHFNATLEELDQNRYRSFANNAA